jgi:hypothetical protein
MDDLTKVNKVQELMKMASALYALEEALEFNQPETTEELQKHIPLISKYLKLEYDQLEEEIINHDKTITTFEKE